MTYLNITQAALQRSLDTIVTANRVMMDYAVDNGDEDGFVSDKFSSVRAKIFDAEDALREAFKSVSSTSLD